MSANQQLTDALLRLHDKACEWLKTSSDEEEARWQGYAEALESEIACETDEMKRLEKEAGLRNLQKLLEHLDNRLTSAYAHLIFAYGLARLGAQTESASLETTTAPFFTTDDTVHQLLYRAFTYRINQARNGEPCRGPLPPTFLPPSPEQEEGQLEERQTRYKFDRLRSRILVLEPSEEVDPFRLFFHVSKKPIEREIALLCDATDAKELEHRTRELLAKHKEPDNALKVLRAALELYPRLPPSFARSLLETTCGLLAGLPPVADLRKHERERRESYSNLSRLDSLSDAHAEAEATHDREFRDLQEVRERITAMDIVARRAADGSDGPLLQCVIRSLLQIIEAQRGDDLFRVIPVLAGRCLQSLQRLNLRRELEKLLSRVTDLIHNQPILTLSRGGGDDKWDESLRLLLNVAAGWLFLGRSDMAAPMIEKARTYLFAPMPKRQPHAVTQVVCRYIATLALSPVESTLNGLDELFPGIGPLTDSLSTRTHFSQLRLQIIDSVVRAVVHLAHPEDDVDDYLAVSLN